MNSPRFSLALALCIASASVLTSGCKTIYSDVYSYRKNYFDPYETRDMSKLQAEEAKRLADSQRRAADKDAKDAADKMNASQGAGLQLDSGLGGPSLGSPSIPGLSGSSAAPSIPGLDSAPSMSGGAMAPGTPGMSGEAAKPSIPGL
jgi:hypothetical protein